MSQTYQTKPSLGIWRATSLVTGNIIGAGIFMLPASLAMYGTIGLLGLIATAFGAMCLAFVFARLSHDMPKIGGPYAYSREAFGDFIGFQMAWSYWVGTWASVAAITIAFVSYAAIFWPELNDNPGLSFGLSLATVWLFTLINIIGVKTAGIVQLVTTILKLLPLALLALFGVTKINPENFFPIIPEGQAFWPSLSAAAALTLFSFVGLESATIPAEDVQQPRKTIYRATLLGTLVAALIYISMMVVVLGLLTPQELISSQAPFVDAGKYIFGSWAGPLVAIAAILCSLGTLNGWTLVQGQMPVAMARDGLFPAFFDKHTKNGAPYMSLIISGVLITILLFMNYEAGLVEQFNTIVFFATFTVILNYIYSAAAELYFLLVLDHEMDRGRLIRATVVSLLSFGDMLFILIGAGERAAFLGMIFLFSGFPIYVFMKGSYSRLAN